MAHGREQEIIRITAQFVEEQEAGLRPRLEDYARRYPQYVDEIADFVTYYYAVEVGLPTNTSSVPSLSAGTRAALDLAWERVNTPAPGGETPLELLAKRQRCSLARLGVMLDLSSDLMELLAKRELVLSSLPLELVQRLTRVLNQPLHVVREALGLPAVPTTPAITERRASYAVSDEKSFREALLDSEQLTANQRERWLKALTQEGL